MPGEVRDGRSLFEVVGVITGDMASRSLRVALVGPPLDASGGIGRAMSYALAAFSSDDAKVRVLDTRGHSRHPLLSLFPLARTCCLLAGLTLRGQLDVVHVNISARGSSIRKPAVLWTARFLGLPVVLHLHASSYREFFGPLPRPAKWLLRKTFAAAAVVFVLGDVWREYVCDSLQVPRERVQVLPYAVTGPERVEWHIRAENEPLRLLLLGRLGVRKGVPEILGALSCPQLRETQWLATLAGDGDVEFYRREAARLGLADRVVLPGWIGSERAAQLLGESHVLLLPSYAEGLPVSVIEALAHGVPVVSTPVGAIAEAITDGQNGLLVPPGDSAALATAIRSLLDDEALRCRLARRARETWEERYRVPPYARRLVATWSAVARTFPSRGLLR